MAVTDKDKSDGYTDSLMEVEVTGNALENENKKVNGGGKKKKRRWI
tara:strand:- start:1118 stop:1255 length:138 start_codon:yes stop_codon:yes gene_type:complete